MLDWSSNEDISFQTIDKLKFPHVNLQFLLYKLD